MKPIIPFSDFEKLDLCIGKIVACESKEGSEKLLRLTVDFGEEGIRTILSGIAKFYTPQSLIGKSFLFILNLEPRTIMGEQSQGMILAAGEDTPVLLKPVKKVPAGSTLR